MTEVMRDLVVYKLFPNYKSAANQAKALAPHYRSLVIVRREGDKSAVMVPKWVRSQLMDEEPSGREVSANEKVEHPAASGTVQSAYKAAKGRKDLLSKARPVDSPVVAPVIYVKNATSKTGGPALKPIRPRVTKNPRRSPPYPAPIVAGPGVVAIQPVVDQSRMGNLVLELRQAYESAPPDEMTAWINATLARFGGALVRRVGNVGNLCTSLVEGLGREIIDLKDALVDRRASGHLQQRACAAGQSASEFVGTCWGQSSDLISALRRDPAKVGPDLLVGALAFYYAGGGIDGDGGVPDMDISMLGFGAHRSLFTHSILSGAVIETGLFSLYDFLSRAYKYLPIEHDLMWDSVHQRIGDITSRAAQGASLGMAYHMGVDATSQPAAYHDLPFHASMEVHQTIMGVNATAEGLDISKKPGLSGGAAKTSGTRHAPKVERNLTAICVGAAAVVGLEIIDIFC